MAILEILSILVQILSPLPYRFIHNLYLLISQSIQLIDKIIDLPVEFISRLLSEFPRIKKILCFDMCIMTIKKNLNVDRSHIRESERHVMLNFPCPRYGIKGLRDKEQAQGILSLISLAMRRIVPITSFKR